MNEEIKVEDLTVREKDLIVLVVKGKNNPQIATLMGIKEGSVKEYVSRIFRKLGLTNRTELAVWGFRMGL